MTGDDVRHRVASVCASAPFAFIEAQTPFSFELQPSGVIDEVFRIESEQHQVLGGFSFTEDRVDVLHVWVARKYSGDPEGTYSKLLTDASSIRAAVIRDGCVTSGEYSVPDTGAGISLQRDTGKEYAVMRVTVPVNYEATV